MSVGRRFRYMTLFLGDCRPQGSNTATRPGVSCHEMVPAQVLINDLSHEFLVNFPLPLNLRLESSPVTRE